MRVDLTGATSLEGTNKTVVQTKQVCATVFLCYNLILLSIHAIYFVFPYQINFIRLSMAPASVQYAYRMNGGEVRWTDIGERNPVYFTNLLPGHYLLEVRATNLSNRWSPNVTRLEIEVLPAWWATGYSRTYRISSLLVAQQDPTGNGLQHALV